MGPGHRAPLPVRAVGRPAPLRARHADRQGRAGASFCGDPRPLASGPSCGPGLRILRGDRKSTRLNSSHVRISYAVFCLKKKKKNKKFKYDNITEVNRIL